MILINRYSRLTIGLVALRALLLLWACGASSPARKTKVLIVGGGGGGTVRKIDTDVIAWVGPSTFVMLMYNRKVQLCDLTMDCLSPLYLHDIDCVSTV